MQCAASWIPRMLPVVNRQMCREILAANFKCSQEVNYNSIFRLIPQDKTCIYHYDPESKAQSKEWKRPESHHPGSSSKQHHQE